MVPTVDFICYDQASLDQQKPDINQDYTKLISGEQGSFSPQQKTPFLWASFLQSFEKLI